MAEISSFERMVRPDTVLIVKLERDAFFGSQTVNGSEWGQSQSRSGKTTRTGAIKCQEQSSIPAECCCCVTLRFCFDGKLSPIFGPFLDVI